MRAVSGVPSAVKRLSIAMQIWTSASCLSKSLAVMRSPHNLMHLNRALPKVAPPEDFVKLTKVAERYRVPMEVILIGVFRHHLERLFRLQSEPGLGGLPVDPQEVKALPARIPDKDMPFVL